ncbi:MAG: hypothetical protein MUO26_10005 [Methanotrichaceae archaeon]|nr:hypothetical protein [Methanotrichaceae archaeon]
MGEPRKCYENCLALVDDRHTIYAGYTLNKGRQEDIFGNWWPLRMWIPHAWLVNRSRVIETTPDTWLAYFGIPVTPDELLYITTNGVPGEPYAVDIRRNLPY